MKKRLLSILLASLLCAGSVSCSGKAAEENASADGGTPPDQTVTAAPETPAPETEPEEETISPDLPGELDYGGETVHIVKNPLVLLREFNTEELTGEVVDDALYNSYTAVCERLNVDFELIDVESSNSKQAAYVSAITKSVQSASGAYDFISGYSMCFPTLAAQGMLNDLLPTEYIDMEKPWWSSQLVKQSAVNGKLFFATGDISNQLLYNMVVTFFNKNLAAEYNLESPYTLVDERKWTLDKMAELCHGVYTDLNGNGKADGEDRYGYSSSPVFTDAFWFSAGLTYIDLNEDGVPVISENLSSERAADLVTKIQSMLNDGSNDMSTTFGSFEAGNVLFHSNEMLMASWAYRDLPFDFGVVPVPTYSEDDAFSTCASFTYTLYGIPLDARDPDMSSAVMEAMAYEGWKTVTPAVFETAMKLKYTHDEDSIRMLDIIRDSISFDFGRVFNSMLSSITWQMFRGVVNGTGNWSSTLASNLKMLDKMLGKLIEKFE